MLKLIFVFLLLLLIVPTTIYLLWPSVVVPIFGLPEITWLQSAGLWLICDLLFEPTDFKS